MPDSHTYTPLTGGLRIPYATTVSHQSPKARCYMASTIGGLALVWGSSCTSLESSSPFLWPIVSYCPICPMLFRIRRLSLSAFLRRVRSKRAKAKVANRATPSDAPTAAPTVEELGDGLGHGDEDVAGVAVAVTVRVTGAAEVAVVTGNVAVTNPISRRN